MRRGNIVSQNFNVIERHVLMLLNKTVDQSKRPKSVDRLLR